MPSTNLTFPDRNTHRAWLATQATLPAGFRAGTARFGFMPKEAPKPAKMTLTLIALDKPTPDFAAVFTKNAFPGAPIIVGRQRLKEPTLGAIIVNNKISNVCAPGGVEASERVCAEVAKLLKISAKSVLPSSTGVIGWGLPVDAMLAGLPQTASSLAAGSILPAAEGIVTTDLYPKIRRADLGGGSIFTFSVLLDPASGAAGASEDARARAALHGVRALVVDDTEHNRIIVEEQLSWWGVASDSAQSAAEAMALLEHSLLDDSPRYSIVLLDLAMPQQDGLDLARTIRSRPEWAGLRLLMLRSGWWMAGL